MLYYIPSSMIPAIRSSSYRSKKLWDDVSTMLKATDNEKLSSYSVEVKFATMIRSINGNKVIRFNDSRSLFSFSNLDVPKYIEMTLENVSMFNAEYVYRNTVLADASLLARSTFQPLGIAFNNCAVVVAASVLCADEVVDSIISGCTKLPSNTTLCDLSSNTKLSSNASLCDLKEEKKKIVPGDTVEYIFRNSLVLTGGHA